jgi:ribosomal protein S18 acetylase RimI-like enzyme
MRHDERMSSVRLRAGGPGDAEGVATLHADSWRRHYRGAYADSYLDGDVVADRRAVWSARLTSPNNSVTLIAEDGDGLVGFVHVVLDDDARWGSLIDNLHVTRERQRGGVGTALVRGAFAAVVAQATSISVYLWVLEQNAAAQGFYRAMGGTCVEKATVAPPGGVPDRLNGAPNKLRFAWPDASSPLR